MRGALAAVLRDDFVAAYERELPAVVQCFRDDFDACIAHLRFPLRHRRVVRTTNLLERLFLEERRRTKIIPQAFGERPVLKLMYAAVIRAADRWRGLTVGEFELATGTVRAVKIVYQMVASGLAAPDAVEWEIAMWYAPELGVFVKGVDRAFGLVTFELDRSIDVATLRRRAGLPELPALLPALDYRVRHRDAAKDLTCGLHCPPPAASELR